MTYDRRVKGLTQDELIEIDLMKGQDGRILATTNELHSSGRHPATVMAGIRHQSIDRHLKEEGS